MRRRELAIGLVFCFFVLSFAFRAQVARGDDFPSPSPAKTIMLKDIIKNDGTIDLSSGLRGSIDPSGYMLVSDGNSRPRFTASSPVGDDRWSSDFWTGDLNREVYALAADGSGNLYVGGFFQFTGAGGVVANYIAKWDGSGWSALGSGTNGAVLVLVADPNGDLYAGGDFQLTDGVSTSYVSRLHGSTWSALGSGVNAPVTALAISRKENLLAGGDFTTAGDKASSYIAEWQSIPALAADYGAQGLWLYKDGSWDLMNSFSPDTMTSYGCNLALGYASYGLHAYDGSSWTQLSPDGSAQALLGISSTLYADYGSSGLWKYDGVLWSCLAYADAGKMANFAGSLVVSFAGYGLFNYDGSWTLLTSCDSVESTVSVSNKLYADFGTHGLWRYDGSWTLLASADASMLGSYGNKLVANFPRVWPP